MIRRAWLRRRKPLARVSARKAANRPAWAAVYAEVDARSDGFCEVHARRHRATEHHHLFKPRQRFHEARFILHVCRAGHREFERPYRAGRRVPTEYDPVLERFRTVLVVAPDKWAARRLA